MGKVLYGRAWKLGDDIDTDRIIQSSYLNSSDPKFLAQHCLEEVNPEFPGKVKAGDIIVAGKNFGCGSSREHAPIALQGAGISCVIAQSFARLFFRNSINIAMPAVESPEAVADIEDGHIVEVDIDNGIILNKNTGKKFEIAPFNDYMKELLEMGGLMGYIEKWITDNDKE